MAIVAGDFVQVLHEGSNNLTDFVVSYRRYSSLCQIGDTFEIVFSSDMDETINPYDDFRITESYDGDTGVVIRGYPLIIDQDFGGLFVVQGQDRSVLLFDYFIPTQIKSQGESVDFWIQFYADQVGLPIEFQASSANVVVAEGTLMGMQSAGEGILTMERLAAYFVRYDSPANKLVAYRLKSSEPVITIDDVTEGRRLKGTEKTRNVVRVYGGYRFSLDPADPPELLTSVARTEMPELLVDKTVVVASPGLQKQTFLDIVADRILNTVNSIDDVHFYSLPQFVQSLEVGQIASLNVSHLPHINYAGERKITSIEAAVDENGVQTIVGIGEKCPRVSIQFPTPPVYATTTEDGVAVSWNAGNSFAPSNTGLTGSGLFGNNIGVNSYGQQMVNTAAGIFKRPSTAFNWSFVDDVTTLPNPVNDSNDQPSGVAATDLDIIRIVDEPTNRNVFHFLANATTSGLGRSWVYTTKDFGNSWDSTQMYFTASGQDHPVAPSGLSYDVYGHDLFGGVDNSVYALVTSLADFFIEKFDPDVVYFGAKTTTASNRAWAGTYDGNDWPFPSTITHDHTAGDIISQSQVFSLPEDRDICYWVIKSVHNPDTERAWFVSVLRTDDGGSTWDILIDEVSFYSGDFSGPGESEVFDNGGFIMFDYASTRTNFNFTITATTYERFTGDTDFYSFFFNDNYETDTHNHVTPTKVSTVLGDISDVGIFSMNHERPSAHSTNLTGTNYGYSSVYATDAIINEVPEFVSVNVEMAIARYDMTAQTVSIVQTVSQNFPMGPDNSWITLTDGGVFAADGTTPYWFWSYRERIDDSINDYDRHYMYLAGSSTILHQHEENEIFIPFGALFATGTGGAIAIDSIFDKVFYTSSARISPAEGNLNNNSQVNQGRPSDSNWTLLPAFLLHRLHNNLHDVEQYWTTSVSELIADNFAWKDFFD